MSTMVPHEAQSRLVTLRALGVRSSDGPAVSGPQNPRERLAASVWRALDRAVDDTPVGRLIVAAICDASDQYAAQLIEQALRPQPVPGGMVAR